VGHDGAHRWYEAQGRESWATCPLTENGVIRIVSHPNYPGAPGPPATVAAIVAEIRRSSTKAVKGGKAALHLISGQ
jgi:predicted nucleic acid-binding protein